MVAKVRSVGKIAGRGDSIEENDEALDSKCFFDGLGIDRLFCNCKWHVSSCRTLFPASVEAGKRIETEVSTPRTWVLDVRLQ